MDYTRKNSGDNIQDSELVKINQNTTIHSLNNKTFVNNILFADSIKINVLNGNDTLMNQKLNNTLFYNHNDDDNKVNSTIRTQCIIFLPLVCIIILLPFFIFNNYLIIVDNKKIEEDIYNEKCISFILLILIFLCYFLSIKTSSKQMKIEKYLYKNITNNNNEVSNEKNNINNEKNKNEEKTNNNDNNNNINENIYSIKDFHCKDENESQNIIYFYLKNYNQVCNYCHIRSFIRATHCLVCDECILFKQEHCQYIINCIGFNNIQYFINFLFWSICGLIYYSFFCIKFFINFEYDKIGFFITSLIISNFIFNLMILIMLVNKINKLFKNIWKNITQYEQQIEENEKNNLVININSNSNYKEHNLFSIGFLSHLYYIIGPTPFHFFLPLPKIKTYGNNENCPIFLKCKFPNRLELIKYLAKKDPKYKDLLNDVESDPNNYIKLCHDYYDDKLIK